MKAKLIKEYYNNPTEGPMDSDDNYEGFNVDEYGTVTYLYSADYRHGEIKVDLADVMGHFNLTDEEDIGGITDEMFDQYASEVLDSNDIEWNEDEGPDPDEMRDWKHDR